MPPSSHGRQPGPDGRTDVVADVDDPLEEAVEPLDAARVEVEAAELADAAPFEAEVVGAVEEGVEEAVEPLGAARVVAVRVGEGVMQPPAWALADDVLGEGVGGEAVAPLGAARARAVGEDADALVEEAAGVVALVEEAGEVVALVEGAGEGAAVVALVEEAGEVVALVDEGGAAVVALVEVAGGLVAAVLRVRRLRVLLAGGRPPAGHHRPGAGGGLAPAGHHRRGGH